MEPLNLQHLLSRFSDHWSQRTIGTLNDYEIKLAKLLGEFVWHSHADTDELFLIIYGTLNIQLRDRDVILKPGEVFVVRRGVEHVSDYPNALFPITYPDLVITYLDGFWNCYVQLSHDSKVDIGMKLAD